MIQTQQKKAGTLEAEVQRARDALKETQRRATTEKVDTKRKGGRQGVASNEIIISRGLMYTR